jgi:hypothetical protein
MSHKKRFHLLAVFAIFLALLASCAPREPQIVEIEVTRQVTVEVTRVVEVEVTPEPAEPPVYVQETALQTISLAHPLADCHAEISSMAWYGDTLIVVPQYPNFYLPDVEKFGLESLV